MPLQWKNGWPIAKPDQLARFVTLDPPVGLSEDILQEPDLKKRTELVYGKLSTLELKYAWEPWNEDSATQVIRHPDLILASGVGTCIDLSLLFCGVCIQARLVPWIVVFNGHVLVMVSSRYDADQAKRNGKGRGGDRGLFQSGGFPPIETLQARLNGDSSFFAVECTGYAKAVAEQTQAPGGTLRKGGILEFSDAMSVALEIVAKSSSDESGKLVYRQAIDVLIERTEKGASEETCDGDETATSRALRINRQLVAKLSQTPLSPHRNGTVDYTFGGTLEIVNTSSSEAVSEIDCWKVLRQENMRLLFLTGPGGCGKSSAVQQTVRHVLESDVAFIVLNLKNYSVAVDRFGDYPAKTQPFPAGIEWLMNLSVAPLQQVMEVLTAKVLLIFDGLNEVFDVRTRIHDLIKWILWKYPQVRILVTTRELPGDLAEWSRDRLTPVAGGIGTIAIDVDACGKGLAYYRDNGADHYGLLTTHLGLKDDQIATLAQIALSLYSDGGKTSFTREDLDNREEIHGMKGSVYLRLLRSHQVVTKSAGTQDVFAFINQSLQDYLAARHLSNAANARSLWTVHNLDAITMRQASFEALKWALHEMPTTEHADAFLERLYDWNWRAAFECLSGPEGVAADFPAPNHPHSKFVEQALISLLKDKVEDRIYRTRIDAVRISQQARTITPAVVAEPNWLQLWKTIYSSAPVEGPVNGLAIGAIVHPHSIIGWTAANVLRRFHPGSANPLTESQIATLVGLFHGNPGDTERDNAVRWRVVHTLGVFPSQDSVELLLAGLRNDRYFWVRFGCARAIIEAAVRISDNNQRTSLLSSLLEVCRTNSGQRMAEALHIGASALNAGADDAWYNDIRPLLTALQEMADDRSKTMWDAVIRSLDDPPSWRGMNLVDDARVQSGLF